MRLNLLIFLQSCVILHIIFKSEEWEELPFNCAKESCAAAESAVHGGVKCAREHSVGNTAA